MQWYSFLVLLILLSAACTTAPAEQNAPSFSAPFLQVTQATSVFDQAGGKIIQTLAPSTVIEDLSETSTYLSYLSIDGKTYCEPWVKIAWEGGNVGWIFPVSSQIEAYDQLDYTTWIEGKRMQAIFGKEQKTTIEAHKQAFETIQTVEDFIKVYRESRLLQDTLILALQESNILTDTRKLPDLFWMKNNIPGLIPQVANSKNAYVLFQDYRQWALKAEQTPKDLDDQFIALYYKVYSADSVEYTFPAWTIEYTEGASCSLLGRGIHKELLDHLLVLIEADMPFVEELNLIRQALVEDITQSEIAFWEPSTLAIQELDAILAAAYPFLSKEDWVGLKSRRQQMEEPREWGIRFNLKSGIYN